jgi:hypothetical protein
MERDYGVLRNSDQRTPRLSVAMTVSTDNPRAFVADSGRLLNLIQDDTAYDSRMIEVIDSSGKLVFVSTWDNRLRKGTAWAQPGLGDD